MRLHRVWLVLALAVLGGCPSPAAPPAPPAEIPALLTIPSSLSIDVSELSSPSAPSALKLLTATPSQTRQVIESASGIIREENDFLDNALFPISQTSIPVSSSQMTFESTFTEPPSDRVFHFKFDFRRFDLDGDGQLESCSGCTCPLGCAPDLAVCPAEAPEQDLKPICFRIWVDDERLIAGVFDRVPTTENPQSGRFRIQLPQFADLGASLLSILYDHSDPLDKRTEMLSFFRDPDVDPNEFFSSRHQLSHIEGPEETAKKTVQLTTAFLSPPVAAPGSLQFQAAYIANLDFMSLEVVTDGVFGSGGVLGIPSITPPICAQISTGNPASDVLCEDIDITVTPGNFLSLPQFSDVDLPSTSQFPETPTF